MLQTEVLAKEAAESGSTEQYRYECSCCGEEVYIAAAHSTSMVAHFRHRSGNNDVECENYLGNAGTLNTGSSSSEAIEKTLNFIITIPAKRLYRYSIFRGSY